MMRQGTGSVKESIKSIEQIAGRAGSDTIRLWESYRDQAYLWRALALLQMPATALAVVMTLIMYFTKDTIIEVPDMPQPGYYSITKLPDSQFIGFAEEIVNLIASYQPINAHQQFQTARSYLWEPALGKFENEMLGKELRAIEETKRSQLFFADKRLVNVERYPEEDYVVVRIPGTRQKLIGDKHLPPEYMAYYVKMTTIPRNVHNEYGIVIIDISLRKVTADKMERSSNKEDSLGVRFQRKVGTGVEQ